MSEKIAVPETTPPEVREELMFRAEFMERTASHELRSAQAKVLSAVGSLVAVAGLTWVLAALPALFLLYRAAVSR